MKNTFEVITDWIVDVGFWIVVGIAIVELAIGYIVIKGVIW